MDISSITSGVTAGRASDVQYHHANYWVDGRKSLFVVVVGSSFTGAHNERQM